MIEFLGLLLGFFLWTFLDLDLERDFFFIAGGLFLALFLTT
jgi:hypothetical protein